ncbi:choice-of-anchor B family protein [Flavobacteriaceae bacterium]|nr:choice-of-anchor B family protein [Flavobacteriaceae bacterium]MDC3238206.1 choice-of-anchor B family protein [Flavobacteriaceae bacterium]
MNLRLILLFLLSALISCQEDNLDDEVLEPLESLNNGNDNGTDNQKMGTPCVDGFAGKYPCKGYDLLAHIDLSTLGSGQGNDCWGWTDSSTGKEYVLMGLDNGTAFVDINESTNPILIGKLPTTTENSSWRDIKVYDNHAYIVSEADSHGVQVFDLTRLREANPPENFSPDRVLQTVPTAHNMVVNPDSGYGYVVGTDKKDDFRGGVHFLDLNNPQSIKFVGGYADAGYSHDAQVVNYRGPDQDYVGKEIFIGSNESKLVVIDVTDKQNPKTIAETSYQNIQYVHQGWFDKTQRFFILGDELDEFRLGGKTRTLVFDLNDLDNPVLHHTYYGPTAAIDHNGYVVEDLFYLANYSAGIRVIDIGGLADKNMREIGFFDTFPEHNSTVFNGAWNVYPFFESGVIAISDINRGLFLIKKSE